MPQQELFFRNRKFSENEIAFIKKTVNKNWNLGRTKIAKIICQKLNWKQLNGNLNIIACCDVLRRMQKSKIIELPPSKPCGGYRELKKITKEEIKFSEPKKPIVGSIEDFKKIEFKITQNYEEQKLWRYLIQTYHYLGYRRTVGKHLRYLVYLDDKLSALLGFGDAILHHHLRDSWIGWTKQERMKRLHLIVNNVRFLILPWVRVRNLASKILSIVSKILPQDWKIRYGYQPLFLETFVDISKFIGTSYISANWIFLGTTAGKGRSGLSYFLHNNPKHYYIYPLEKFALEKIRGWRNI